MRGKPKSRKAAAGKYRITPAYAGKTVCSSPRYSTQQDHPRVCGENVWVDSYQDAAMGSPPRMRGKLIEFDWYSETLGDHPRVCGENTKKIL